MASNSTLCANNVSADSLTVNKVYLYKNLAIACANTTAALDLTASQSGGTILGALASAAKTINLPTAEVGLRFKFIQTAATAGGGVYTIKASVAATNSFTTSSYIINQANAGVATLASPVAANNQLVITGKAGNSVFGIGSRIEIVCVSAGEWDLKCHSLPTGNGEAVTDFAFTTAV